MEGIHSNTCGECYHWFRLPGEAPDKPSNLGECFAHPPRVFKIAQVSVNPLTNQPTRMEGLISHYPPIDIKQRACGEFKPNLELVNRKEIRS